MTQLNALYALQPDRKTDKPKVRALLNTEFDANQDQLPCRLQRSQCSCFGKTRWSQQEISPIQMIDLTTLWRFDLRRGSSDHPCNGACLMDAANWIVRGKIGDDPDGACPVIRAYAIELNDLLPDDQRQRLKQFILRVIDNRDPASEQARAKYLVEQIVKLILPLALAVEAEANRRNAEGSAGDWTTGANMFVISGVKATHSRAAIADAAQKLGYLDRAGEYAGRAAEAAAECCTDDNLRQRVYDAAIETLDGVLKIGKQAAPSNMAVVVQAVNAFDQAQ